MTKRMLYSTKHRKKRDMTQKEGNRGNYFEKVNAARKARQKKKQTTRGEKQRQREEDGSG